MVTLLDSWIAQIELKSYLIWQTDKFPLRLHVYPGWNKLLEGYLCLLQLKDAVDVLWCFKTHFAGDIAHCSDLIMFLGFFYTPQDKNPIRGEIVLSSNDFALELQVERNQWVFLCSYHLLCLITFVCYHYSQLFHFLTWYGRINWIGRHRTLYYYRRYQKAATTLYTCLRHFLLTLNSTFFANARTLCYLS